MLFSSSPLDNIFDKTLGSVDIWFHGQNQANLRKFQLDFALRPQMSTDPGNQATGDVGRLSSWDADKHVEGIFLQDNMTDNDIIESGQDGNSAEEIIDQKRRNFLLAATGVMGGIGAVCALSPLVGSWLPSAQAQAAGAPVEVDLSKLEPGQQVTVAWQGKPVWIIRRTKAMLDNLAIEEQLLRDPESLAEQQPEYAKNRYRSINPEYLVLVGICTHLGCSPKYTPEVNALGPNWAGGFYCPCHGSTFDLAGRVFKGVPAPINLEVPPYMFIREHVIVIGKDKE